MPVLTETKEKQNKVFLAKFSCNTFLCAASPKTKKRYGKNAKNRYRSASLTAEAALVFPIFFFTVYLLWQLFLLVLFQTEVCHEITAAAMKYSHLGYAERRAEEGDVDISWLYQPLLWNSLPESDRVENLWLLCVPEEDGTVLVRVGYRFVCEAVFFTEYRFPVQQKFRFYPYLGKTDEDLFQEEQETDVVYMTEYGTVYHESRACSYLNVVVRPVAAKDVGNERNASGRRYSLCERCDDEKPAENVYISAGGTKYHLIASCPALKRTVTEKSREEVDGVPACHKCGNIKKEE